MHGETTVLGDTLGAPGAWGPTTSATFNVGTTNVATDIGNLSVTLNTDGSYTSTLTASNPLAPADPYKLFASVKTNTVTTTLGFTHYTLAVSAGRIDFDTKVDPVDPIIPNDPDRILVTTLVATNSLQYKARIDGFTTRFLPPNPV